MTDTIKTKHPTALAPFVKWAGGKRQLLNDIISHVPDSFSYYFEPFLGGAAVLLHLQPKRAFVNDLNGELINLYRVVQYRVNELIEALRSFSNDKEFFYAVRAWDRMPGFAQRCPIERAARTLYLNRTAFNGLYRVNKEGQFNAPFGYYKSPDFIQEDALRAANAYFSQSAITFLNGSFEDALRGIPRQSFVYLDPPYDAPDGVESFVGYTAQRFDRDSQVRLRECCDQLTRQGVRFLLSNAHTPFILEQYAQYHISLVDASRTISAKGSTRARVQEVLIKNY